jgi:hypothetical protein
LCLDSQARLPEGPSELGPSLALSVTPDVITDGQSQASIEIVARDSMNQFVRGLMHVETLVSTTAA